jgi:hypothetical protein
MPKAWTHLDVRFNATQLLRCGSARDAFHTRGGSAKQYAAIVAAGGIAIATKSGGGSLVVFALPWKRDAERCQGAPAPGMARPAILASVATAALWHQDAGMS